MSRYYRETECEHGNMRCPEVVEWPLNVATNANDFIPRLCPGGKRVEIRIDYELFADGVALAYGHIVEPAVIRSAVDAALQPVEE